jgi:hypothetical protein
MKLALSTQDNISVLAGTEEITVRDVKVLQAGLKKLLTAGKNRIILFLPDTERLPPEIIREISQFDMLARELSGRIILAGNSPKLKEQVQLFAKPPVIACFDSKEAALQEFKNQQSAQQPAPSKPLTPEEIKKESAQQSEILKKVSVLEDENALLKEQLLTVLSSRKTPPNEAAYQARIQILEKQVEELNAFLTPPTTFKG